jgi:branched-chain amino acid transport system ATP-binding protein
MKAIVGIASCIGGTITFRDTNITGMAPEDVVHEGIGYVPQTNNIFPTLTVEENLRIGAYVLETVPEERKQEVYDRFPVLANRPDEEAGSLSGGQQQMFAMGCALMLDPDVLLLDKLSAGLAPDLVGDMFDRIDAINEAGTTVLMVEQNAQEALRRCDRGYVLANGENRYEDDGDALLDDEEVRRQFLGG